MNILIAEDDSQLSAHLSTSLRSQGFGVTIVSNLAELETALDGPAVFQVIVLDRLLGSYDTKESLPRIKARFPEVPVVILSAISTPSERTDLLNQGADDYVGKPFATQELIARIRVVHRRAGHPPSPYVRLGDTVLDVMKRVVSVGNASAALPPKEFLLMKVLCDEPGRVWSRSELLERVWEMHTASETNVVEATITNLRRRLASLGSSVEINNMRNAGYWIEA